jgi:hypothetical protein
MKSLYLLAYVEMYIKFCSELVNDGKKYIETKTLDANINQNICKKVRAFVNYYHFMSMSTETMLLKRSQQASEL